MLSDWIYLYIFKNKNDRQSFCMFLYLLFMEINRFLLWLTKTNAKKILYYCVFRFLFLCCCCCRLNVNIDLNSISIEIGLTNWSGQYQFGPQKKKREKINKKKTHFYIEIIPRKWFSSARDILVHIGCRQILFDPKSKNKKKIRLILQLNSYITHAKINCTLFVFQHQNMSPTIALSIACIGWSYIETKWNEK